MSDTVLMEFPSENGIILVEVAEKQVGPQPASLGSDGVRKAKQTFVEAVAGIQPIARAVLAQIEGLAVSQATVEFGIKLTGKAGVVLASTETEGHLKLTLTWTKKPE